MMFQVSPKHVAVSALLNITLNIRGLVHFLVTVYCYSVFYQIATTQYWTCDGPNR